MSCNIFVMSTSACDNHYFHILHNQRLHTRMCFSFYNCFSQEINKKAIIDIQNCYTHYDTILLFHHVIYRQRRHFTPASNPKYCYYYSQFYHSE